MIEKEMEGLFVILCSFHNLVSVSSEQGNRGVFKISPCLTAANAVWLLPQLNVLYASMVSLPNGG